MKRPLKILLVNPEDIEANQRVSEITPFVGLAYIAAYAQEQLGDAISIEIAEMLPQQLHIDDIVSKVLKNSVHLCAVTSKTYNFPFALKLASAIKRASPDTLIIFGGAHASALPEETAAEPDIDAIIQREGERVFKNLLQMLLDGKAPFKGVKGIVYKSNGKIINNGFEPLIEDIDKIPTPDWGRLYDLKKYEKKYDDRTGKFYRMLPVFASRGCPFECHFCQPLLTRQYRTRPVDSVIDEIIGLEAKYGIKKIYFEDSIFGAKKEWFMEFCRRFIETGLNKQIIWGFETNVNFVDQERMALAKEAGCVYVYLGMESASDKIHEHLGKGATKEKLRKAVYVSKEAGILEVAGSFIFGLPYESSETVTETLEFLKESKLDVVNVHLLDVYPGTRLYKMVESGEGGIRWIPGKKDKWDACGRTMVKTYVNDLDSLEKLEEVYKSAMNILHAKYRKNSYAYMRKIVKYFFHHLIHNPKRLRWTIRSFASSYLPRFINVNK